MSSSAVVAAEIDLASTSSRRFSGTATSKASKLATQGDQAHSNYKGDRTDTTVGTGGGLLHHETARTISRDLYCIVLPATKKANKKNKSKVNEELKQYRDTLVNDLVAAGLEVTLFYSTQEDEVYVKIGADDARLLAEADHNEYVLSLDEGAMKTVAESDRELPDRKPIQLEAPFDHKQRIERMSALGSWGAMSDSEVTQYLRRYTSISPFKYLHARYNDGWEKYSKAKFGVQIYKVYKSGSILRMADRLKLVQLIIERSRNPDLVTGLRGAGINLQEIVLKRKALGAFALQNALNSSETGEYTVDELFEKWNGWLKAPWNQPLDDIRDYFGEKIALYFAFLGHYTKWLFPAAFLGALVFIHQLINIGSGTGSYNFFNVTGIASVTDEFNVTTEIVVVYSEVPESAAYALFISFWGSFMIEFWKRKQSRLAMEWGTSDFEQTEVVRPEFIATHYIPSPITGKSEPYYSWRSFFAKVLASLVIVFICIGVVVSAIVGIFVFKVFVSLDSANTGLSQETATYMALVINAIVILILGTVYKAIAKKLTEWENHRTDTQFEDALIAKTFIFCFVNSFATLFYLAFIKSGTNILGQTQLCEERAPTFASDACFGNLGTALLIVFLTQMIVNNTMELGLPMIMTRFNIWANTKTKQLSDANKQLQGALKLDQFTGQVVNESDVENSPPASPTAQGTVYGFTKIRSPCEDQFYLKSYEGTFDDFLEITLQFGYVTLFVSAFPLAPFLAVINNQLEIRVDSYKLCKLCRRPANFGAQDIGTWQYIFYIMGLISVLTNAGVIFFTSRVIVIPNDYTMSADAMRVWAWVISVMGVLVCKGLVDYFVSDVPGEVAIQLKREDFIVRKCLARERDDEEEDGADVERVIEASKKVELMIHKVDPFIFDVAQKLAKLIVEKHGDLKTALKFADKNKDGMVSTREFKKFLHALGPESGLIKEELDIVAESLDFNHNGKIELAEIEKLATYKA
ncbi:hypothetical protein BASA81_004133 [Batrachochytrium salamandrivorans]|nr:hypothetical protein BASA81_004133 [Batrachochytrium salamandrivorans]